MKATSSARVGSFAEVFENGVRLLLGIAGLGRVVPGGDLGIVLARLDDDVGDFLWRDFEHGVGSFADCRQAYRHQRTATLICLKGMRLARQAAPRWSRMACSTARNIAGVSLPVLVL